MGISQEEIADLTAALVAIDSTNPDLVPGGAGEAEIAQFVAAWLKMLASRSPFTTSAQAVPMSLASRAALAVESR